MLKTMKQIKEEMIAEAKEKYGEIKPCSSYKTFEECFLQIDDKLTLWFNDSTKSTRLVERKFED